jgi:hypothetical protein
MILELIATCVIGAGVTYTPPAGWTLIQVQTQGQISNCSPAQTTWPVPMYCTAMNYPRYEENTVTIQRSVQVGETVQAPPGCEVKMQGSEPKE